MTSVHLTDIISLGDKMKNYEYLLGRIYTTTAIPVRLFEAGSIEPTIEKGITPSNDCLNDKLLYEFNHRISENTKPYIRDIEKICYFGIASNEKYIVVLGPVMFKNVNPYILELFAKKYHLPSKNFNPIKSIPRSLSAPLCYINYLLNGIMLYESDIVEYGENIDFEKEVKEIEFDESKGIKQSPNADTKSFYSQITFIDKIKNGDVEGVNEIEVGGDYELPNQMAESWDKNLEYLVCSAITLATQAAIQGGLDYMSAYKLNTKYIRRLEKCKNTNDYALLNFEMKKGFATAVYEAKQSPTMSYSEKIKRYIVKNLSSPVTLNDIGEHFEKNHSYLDRIFKSETGKSIMQELRLQRIDKAKELLQKTDLPYLYISEQLCFSSQSHFCSVFKKSVGCTPQQYRLKFQK